MDTIQSLVEQHSFCIDQSLRKFMVDVVRIDGRFYSDKPPLLSVLGAGVYFPLHKTLGLSFAKHAPWLYHILTDLLVGLPLAVGLWFLARCLISAGLSPKAATTTVFLTGGGTIYLPYAVTFNNHVPAAAAITVALYCTLRAEADPERANRWSAIAGFMGGLACNLDLAPGGTAFVGFGVTVFLRKRRFSDLVSYILAAIPPAIAYFLLNWLVTRDFVPIYLHPQYYEYEGSVLRSYDALKRPFGKTIPAQYFHMLFGYRGFFSYSPILLLGLWEALRRVARGGRFRPHALVALAIPVLAAGSYASQTGGMAGGSYGMRWLLAATPLFAFFMGLALVNIATRRMRNLFRVAAAFSLVVAVVGVPRPWSSNIRSPITFLDNIAYFTQTLWPPAKPPVYWIVNLTSLEKGYAYLEIGRWHMNNGYYSAAGADLERARLLDPDRSNLIDYYLGICYDASGSPDLAVKAYERLLAREPDNTGALNNYAGSLMKLGLRQSALAAFRKSLEIEPNKVFTWRGIGQLYLDMGNREEAARAWERALELDPNQPDLHAWLAEVYLQGGNKPKALEQFRQLERLKPNDAAVRQFIRRLESETQTTGTTRSGP
jgi:Tfp pilus assembly protein PilF